ncbi:response regulator, partial [Burkholderia sp. GbtcB21]|uniref:response regulator n=1 Tax=Burkholderia sp. GbtcB21 TaxID=2824766 RepID=UPI001C30F0D1
SSAREPRMYASSSKPDLVSVDPGLPDGDGKASIRGLREWSSVPVIVLSARQQEVEKVAALAAGADDYLAKPIGVPELLARARALFRRAAFVSALLQ